MTEQEKIVANIDKLNSHLNETRDAMKGKVDKAMLEETEKRIIDKMAEQFTALDVENRLKQLTDATEAALSKWDEEDTKRARLGTGGKPGGGDSEADERRQAMRAYMREDDSNPMLVKHRSLRTDDDTKGGFLVPEEIAADIIKTATIINPIRNLARKETLTKGDRLITAVRTGKPTGYFKPQGSGGTESSSTYGKLEIPVHKLTVQTEATDEQLADVAGFENTIIADAAEGRAETEANSFVSGSGVGEPTGFLSSNRAVYVTGFDDAANRLHPNDFATMLAALKPIYAAKARWGFDRTMLPAILNMQTQDGSYLWTRPAGLSAGVPNQLLGHEWDFIEGMGDDGTDQDVPLLFADWASWYCVVDKGGISMLRDPYSAKARGAVQFDWYNRVGGDIYTAEAGRLLRV